MLVPLLFVSSKNWIRVLQNHMGGSSRMSNSGCNTIKHYLTVWVPACRVVSFPDNFSLSGGKMHLVICLFHFGSGAPECWRIVLF